MELSQYDKIVINSSAGKDSLAMLDYLVELVDLQNVPRSKLVVVHANLGRVEWRGTLTLAEEQATLYGLDFISIARPQGDLLAQVRQRGKWPSSKARYCTSDHKRGQIAKVFTQIVKDLNLCRPAKILNCMGLRRQESSARAKKAEFERNKLATGAGKKKIVDNWNPIIDWSEKEVWEVINSKGLPSHPAYKLGMPRLSCVFCIFASRDALLVAGENNPELLEEYCQVEKEIGHDFKHGFKISSIKQALANGERATNAESWSM